MTSEQDANFLSLPVKIQQLIDTVFNSVPRISEPDSTHAPPRKKRKLDQLSSEPAGGFILDSQTFVTTNEPGGFVVEDPPLADFPPSSEPSSPGPSHSDIPFSSIPLALARLNLPADDEETLTVFRNAASGWSKPRGSDEANTNHAVSRADFRAVCTVLLELELEGEEPPSPLSPASPAFADGGGFIVEDEELGAESECSLDNDGYDDPDQSESGEDASEDEYVEGRGHAKILVTQSKSGRNSARSRQKKLLSSDDEDMDDPMAKTLSSQQKADARLAFGLFFPDVPDVKLDEQHIMIKDITRVAKLLKEKIKVEEIIEMLHQFSTVPDGSMSLSDFERMMLVTGTV